jgi:hypothetical protein
MPAALPVEVKTTRAKMKAADSHNRVVVVALEIEALMDTRLAHSVHTISRAKGAEAGDRF